MTARRVFRVGDVVRVREPGVVCGVYAPELGGRVGRVLVSTRHARGGAVLVSLDGYADPWEVRWTEVELLAPGRRFGYQQVTP